MLMKRMMDMITIQKKKVKTIFGRAVLSYLEHMLSFYWKLHFTDLGTT